MAVRAKTCLLFLFPVAALLLSATITLAFSQQNDDIIMCELTCEKLPGADQPSCKQTCKEYHDDPERYRPGGSSRGGGGGWLGFNGGRVGDFGKGEQHSNNPYVFEDRHFTARLESQLGNVRVLQKFTDRSEMFRGIEEYRVGFLEAEPETFIIPNHWDADALLFVVNGEGTISLINPKSRQTFNIKRGDIFRVHAGINAYLINRHNNQKLVLAKILRSVSVPGELQTFFSAGGENRELSFLNAFSPEILEAAYDTSRNELERLFFGPQMQKGVFKKATKEQIKSLEESRMWPFGEKKGPYNVFEKSPSVRNENGHLHEVDSEDFSDLRDINVALSVFNISQGSMVGPFYNTKSTMVLVVPNGEGRFEMACPHLSEQHSRGGSIGGSSGGPTYEKVSSPLRRGTVVVVPAGHPVAIEANGNQNLEVIGFGLNSDKNEWFPLAGRDNVMSQWEDEAMELTFGVPARAVKKVIEKQNQRMFFKGPQRRGRAFE